MEEEEDDLKIYSEEVRDVLSEPPKALFRWGNTILFGFIIMLLVLSYFIKYPDIFKAPITITTEKPPEEIVARSTGHIKEIFVKDKEKVDRNSPLAIIENTANYKDVFALETLIDTLDIDYQNFSFPLEKTYGLNLGDIAPAFTSFEKEYIHYQLNRDLKPYAVEANAQGFEIIQLRKRLTVMKQQKEIGDKELKFEKSQLNRFQKLYDKGVIATQEWETEKLNYLQKEKDLRSLDLQISQLQSSIIDLNRNSQTTVLNKKKDNLNLLRNVLQAFNQFKKAIRDWELNYVLRSSIQGTVSYLQIWSVNQNANSGETIFSIIPKANGGYLGKVLASPQNSGKLKVGQNVNIQLAGYPYREFGILEGNVKSISSAPNSEGSYIINVSLPKKLVTSYGKKIKFQQKMKGTANIITEDLRLIERLFYQIREIFKR